MLKRCDVRGVAICLLNAYVDARHELRLRELVHEELGPDVECSISSDVSPLAKEYARASTTVIDVFMKIIYSRYAERLATGLKELGLRAAGSTSPTAPRCSCRVGLRDGGSRTGSCSPARRPAPCRAPTSVS